MTHQTNHTNKMNISRLAFTLVVLVFLCHYLPTSLSAQTEKLPSPDFSKIFAKYPQSAMTIYDEQADAYIRHNPQRCRVQMLPASTFKIMTGLIGLETGVIAGEDFVIPWDGTQNSVKSWNRDHVFASAFNNSVVWYFVELVQRVGKTRTRQYMQQIGYGNASVVGGNMFWLSGNLRISPDEQVKFLKRLANKQLPFAPKNMALMERLMILEETPKFTWRGKTGWTQISGNIGWLVGWLERNNNRYFYALRICSDSPKGFSKARTELTRRVFREMNLLP